MSSDCCLALLEAVVAVAERPVHRVLVNTDRDPQDVEGVLVLLLLLLPHQVQLQVQVRQVCQPLNIIHNRNNFQ